jgi:hypothetical protein
VSDALYFTRLRWHSGGGIAKLHGRAVTLDAAPDLGAGPVHEVDYAPEAGCWELRERACDARRDMTAAEIRAADALLRAAVA